jgi:hypothetical protein
LKTILNKLLTRNEEKDMFYLIENQSSKFLVKESKWSLKEKAKRKNCTKSYTHGVVESVGQYIKCDKILIQIFLN